MELTTGIVLDFLRLCGPDAQFQPSVASYCTFASLRMLHDPAVSSSVNSVYICSPEIYDKLVENSQVRPEQLYIVTHPDELPDPYQEPGTNLITFRGESPSSLYARLMEMYLIILNWSSRLQQAVIQGSTIQELVDIGQEALVNPFIVLDPALNILGHSNNISPSDESFSRTVELGYTPLDVIDRLNDIHAGQPGYSARTKPRGRFVAPPDTLSKYQKIACPIQDGAGNSLAGLYMHCSVTDPSAGMNDLLDFFADMVRVSLSGQTNQSQKLEDMDYSRYIYHILEGRELEDMTPEHLSAIAGLPLTGEFQLFVLQSPLMLSGEYVLARAKEQLVNTKCTLYKGSIVGVIGCNYKYVNVREHVDQVIAKAVEMSRSFGCTMGISMPFSAFMEMRLAYRQAMKAIELGTRIVNSNSQFSSFNLKSEACKDVFYYEDFYLHHMVLTCAEEIDLKSLCLPQLFNLLEHDRRNHTDNYKVLFTYMEHDRKTTEAAQVLFMHRNNVNYRIKRIEELFGLDLDDHFQRLRLQISFLVVDLM